jgi:hypothetical protein
MELDAALLAGVTGTVNKVVFLLAKGVLLTHSDSFPVLSALLGGRACNLSSAVERADKGVDLAADEDVRTEIV